MAAVDKHDLPLLSYLKFGCLVFWGAWFAIACITNFFDFLQHLGKLPVDWHFRSNNYLLVAQTVTIYHLSSITTNFLFISNTFLQAIAACLFFYSAGLFWLNKNTRFYVNLAFLLSIALWATFVILEEIFISYPFEGVHRELFMFELLTLLAFYLLPQE